MRAGAAIHDDVDSELPRVSYGTQATYRCAL
jgi:hypothetical protein